jgi:uncharacterized protein YqhQ
MPILESGEETTLVGGQAVIEGVMMRAPHSYCVAVRKKDGTIVTTEEPLAKVSDKYPIFKLPVFRGLGILGQAMALGTRALKFSGDVVLAEEEKEAQEARAKQAAETPAEDAAPVKTPEAAVNWIMWINLAASFAFFVFAWRWVPLFLTTKLRDLYPALGGGFLFNLTEGMIHTALLVLFMFALSLAKDIHRVFEFHGAEHKVVFNFESGQPVTVENAQKFTTFHPRCGTSFLFVIALVSVAFHTVIPYQQFWLKFICRVAMLPPVAGVSYELIRFAAKRRGSALAALTAPGLWLQRITTKPPADEQTAVAIRALEGAMALEERQGGPLVIA